MSKRIFAVSNRKTMFEIFQKLQNDAKLQQNRDFGIEVVAPHLHASRGTKFWITNNKITQPLVKKVLIETKLR